MTSEKTIKGGTLKGGKRGSSTVKIKQPSGAERTVTTPTPSAPASVTVNKVEENKDTDKT